jgi:hypothetical protein
VRSAPGASFGGLDSRGVQAGSRRPSRRWLEFVMVLKDLEFGAIEANPAAAPGCSASMRRSTSTPRHDMSRP